MNINLHIERLILEGLPVEQRDGALVREAIEAELTEALTIGGIAKSLAKGGAFASVQANRIHATDSRPRPQSLGQQIARSVYAGIGPPVENAHPKKAGMK